MRAVVPLALVVLALATACGAEDPSASPPVSTAPGEGPAGPSSPPPKLDIEGPPPAWIETESGKLWLGYATFCWRTACADYIAPVCGDHRLTPTIVVRRGEVVRFHLRFDPEQVSLRFFGDGRDVPEIALLAGRTPVWEVDREGAFWLAAAKRGSGWDANYAGCFRFADGRQPRSSEAVSVAEALRSRSGEPLLVEGGLYKRGSGPVYLCSGYAASLPPLGCVEPALVVEGLDLARVEGLKRQSGVVWGTVRVLGTVEDGVLTGKARAGERYFRSPPLPPWVSGRPILGVGGGGGGGPAGFGFGVSPIVTTFTRSSGSRRLLGGFRRPGGRP